MARKEKPITLHFLKADGTLKSIKCNTPAQAKRLIKQIKGQLISSPKAAYF